MLKARGRPGLIIRGAGSGEVAEIPLRIAESGAGIPNNTSNHAVHTYNLFRRDHLIADDQSEIRIILNNFYVSGASETNVGSDYTLQEMSLESPGGVVVPVTFSASRSVSVPDGTAQIVSDPLYPADFGLSSFARATIWWTKGIVSVPLATNSIPRVDYASVNVTGAQGGWYTTVATTPSSTDAAGVYTVSGVALVSGGGIRPVLIGRPSSDNPATNPVFFTAGDSLTAGSSDSGSGNGVYNIGHVGRAMANYGTRPYPLIRYCRSGIALDNFRTSVKGLAYAQYCNCAIDALGTNDMGTVSLGDMQSKIEEIWQNFKDEGIQRVYRLDYYPNATSTDSWATTANQTVVANWGSGEKVDLLQQWFRTKRDDDTIHDVIDLNYLKDSVNTFKWKPFCAADAVHPNELGFVLSASTIRLQINKDRTFTLEDVAGYSGDYDAGDTTKLLDQNGVSPGGGGFTGVIATWVDKSPAAQNGTQSTGASRPAYDGTRTINSLTVPRFDGSDDSISIPAAIVSMDSVRKANSIILIYVPDATTATSIFVGNGTTPAKTQYTARNQSMNFGDTDLAKGSPTSGSPILQATRVRNTNQRLKINNDAELSGSLIRNGIPGTYAIGRYPAGTATACGVGRVINFNNYVAGPELNKIMNDLIMTGPFGGALSWSDVDY